MARWAAQCWPGLLPERGAGRCDESGFLGPVPPSRDGVQESLQLDCIEHRSGDVQSGNRLACPTTQPRSWVPESESHFQATFQLCCGKCLQMAVQHHPIDLCAEYGEGGGVGIPERAHLCGRGYVKQMRALCGDDVALGSSRARQSELDCLSDATRPLSRAASARTNHCCEAADSWDVQPTLDRSKVGHAAHTPRLMNAVRCAARRIRHSMQTL